MQFDTFEPIQRLRDTVNLTNGPDACVETLKHLDNPRPAGRMRDWFIMNHGRKVTTIQVMERSTWAPTGRTIDAKTRATGVYMDDSLRDYAGMRVHHAGSTCLIVKSADAAISYVLED